MPRRDAEAFTAFASARSAALHRAAYLMVGDTHLAQDLVQEALTKTYMAWPNLRDQNAAEAYTRRVITNTAITWFRRKRWRNELPTETLPDAPTGSPEDAQAAVSLIWAALMKLPTRQRAAVVLRYYEDLTIAQTAEVLGCSIGTVKSQVSVALLKLRNQLGEDADLSLFDHLDATTNGAMIR